MLESYITHIRIVEDAAHPSSPPPPDSPSDNKKPRLIIVAVRKSGRVRIHKAKDNANGSFSIGKTWALDDLSCIDSFAGPPPSTAEEQQRRRWAGGVGFVITLLKAYYWEAATVKEKDFFIGSLIKIYRKYTGGKLPQLVGFDPRIIEQIAGPAGQQSRSNAVSGRPENEMPQRGLRSGQVRQMSSPHTPHEIANDGAADSRRLPLGDGKSTSESQEPVQRPPPGFFPGSDYTKPASLSDSQTQANTAQAGSAANQNIPPDISRNTSFSQNEPNSRRLAAAQSVESFRGGNDELNGRLASSYSTEQLRSNRAPVPGSRGLFSGSQRSGSPDNRYNSSLKTSSSPLSSMGSLPERRRPPLSGSIYNSAQDQNQSQSQEEYSTPLASPDLRREDLRPPSRSRDRPRIAPSNTSTVIGSGEQPFRPKQQEKSSLETSSAATPDTMDSASVTSTKSDKTSSAAAASTTRSVPTPPPEPSIQSEEEVHRPGLGPMIKKKSNMEIANAFRKAATAYNAFRPRPGGAGDKLREGKDNGTTGPDGITDVVPAPSLSRPINERNPKYPPVEEGTESAPTSSEAQAEVPAVKITEAVGEEPINSLKEAAEEVPQLGQSAVDPRSKSPKLQEERRVKRRSSHTAKYATALDIDPGLLEGVTVDIDSILADFGWDSEELSTEKVDDLQADIRREIGRVEAGSWLGHLEQKDERVETVDRMLDKAIAECDALDGLLTLYSVELGVSHTHDVRIVWQVRELISPNRPSVRTLPTSKLNRRDCKFKQRIKSYYKTSCEVYWRRSRYLHLSFRCLGKLR